MKKLMISFSVLSIFLFILVLSSCGSQSSVTNDSSSGSNVLSCKISAAKEIKAGKTLPLQFELTNNGGKDIYVLKWHTPFEGIRNYIFRVTLNGKRISYRGRKTKRGNPGSKSYMLIKAKESKTASFNLAKYYKMPKPGLYTISYSRETLFDHTYSVEDLPRKLDAFHQPINIKCNELKVRVTP